MNSKVTIQEILFGIIICALVIYEVATFSYNKSLVNNYYQVYLGGKSVGIINSENKLFDLIDVEQDSIKKEYNVDKIYPPSGLRIQKVKTYESNVVNVKQVYEEIKDLEPFTIEGYEVTIKDEEKKTTKNLFVLNKEDLDIAIKNTILSFVKEENYNSYVEGTQDPTKNDGMEIQDIYLSQIVSIKKTYISTEEHIFTNSDELSLYFLFGTTELEKKYKVKASDTIESIARKNKLGVEDFLVANPSIVSENALLAVGQEVTVSAISPIADIMVDVFETEEQKITYDTVYELDKSLSATDTYIKQAGVNGKSKVTYATKYMDGVPIKTSYVSEETISEPVNRIIVVGGNSINYVGSSTYWAWPTVKPYRITSRYGYRYHPTLGGVKFHNGIDISGVKSKYIYAIQEGTVTKVGYDGSQGNHIVIKHSNGYKSIYMHLKTLTRKNEKGKKVKYTIVHEGDHVEKGQVIGVMGTTGRSTGVHLHLSISKNGKGMNPLNLYK